ncbi:MAG: alanyl-tRNA synthetase [uncultured archaeon A07HB70]|nr:MAG: alanyl-tRNA synthetase [uncultured archaeon A07HB70]
MPAGDVVEAVTAEFGGGGGGSAAFAQAGGMSADPDEVAAYLRESRAR